MQDDDGGKPRKKQKKGLDARLTAWEGMTLPQLKAQAKQQQLKVSGTKQELCWRLWTFRQQTRVAMLVQRWWRGFVVRDLLRTFHPGSVPMLCNDTDFVTLEPLAELPWYERVVLQEDSNTGYGFALDSLLECFQRQKETLTNPYTRQPFPPGFLVKIQRQAERMARLGWRHETEQTLLMQQRKQEVEQLTPQKQVELAAVRLFQYMDGLGHYTNHLWFWRLSAHGLLRFCVRLRDVWEHRSGVSGDTKRRIVPPHGNPFRRMPRRLQTDMFSEHEWRLQVMSIMMDLVTKGVDRDHQTLGAYFVLGSLTMVSGEAAQTMPWLYQAFY